MLKNRKVLTFLFSYFACKVCYFYIYFNSTRRVSKFMINIITEFKDNPTLMLIYLGAFLISIIVALSFHEYAHARVAYNCGDDTAYLAGRMKLNPFAHLNFLGFACLLLFGFGWAEPVPVTPRKFKEYRKGMFLTSIAGVAMNLVLCFISSGLWALVCKLFATNISSEVGFYIYYFVCATLSYTAVINLSLCLFNLLPIYPLDGFNILQSVTKGTNKVVNFLKRYGNIILVILVVSPLLDYTLAKAVDFVYEQIIMFWIKVIGGLAI